MLRVGRKGGDFNRDRKLDNATENSTLGSIGNTQYWVVLGVHRIGKEVKAHTYKLFYGGLLDVL